MSDGILQFPPRENLTYGAHMSFMEEAFHNLAEAYVAEHEGEEAKAKLAQHVIARAFEMCILCRLEHNAINWADIEFCNSTVCPLRELCPKLAGDLMILTGYKRG